ncbi:MAG: hypothetical protein R3E10_16955 [Gemmatimonadota bacterium]
MRRKAGFAFVPLILLLGGALTLALGLLTVTTGLRRAGRIDLERIQARLAAEAGLRAPSIAPALLGAAIGTTLPFLQGRSPGGSSFTAVAERVSHEVFLLVAEGRPAQGPALRRLGRTLWRLDVGTRLGRSPAVVALGGRAATGGGGRIEGDSIAVWPSGWGPAECGVWGSVLYTAFPTGTLPQTAPLRSPVGVGPLDLPVLLSVATMVGPGVVHPAARISGATCILGPGNWGTPSAPGGPCGGHMPFMASSGALQVIGGEGQGVLAVAGDLTLSGGVRYSGVVLVGGRLRVEGGARLEGLVQVAGDVQVSGGGAIVGSGCASARAFEALGTALGGVPLPDGGWIEPL